MSLPVGLDPQIVAQLPTRSMTRRLARFIPLLAYEEGNPPAFLYATGKTGRCNPAGTECVYFSETERVAAAEYRRQWKGTPGEHQPRITCFARVRLARVVNLARSEIRDALGLCEEDMFGNWRGLATLTKLQRLGLAIAGQARISAIRYPSAGAHAAAFSGCNVVVFRAALHSPDSLEIIGRQGCSLERWP